MSLISGTNSSVLQSSLLAYPGRRRRRKEERERESLERTSNTQNH